MKMLFIVITVFFISFPAFAQTPSEADIETRAREVGRSLRCVVCQNQSIDESDASLAQDMRILVRARIRAGDSNDEVISFMQNRYGDFVLLNPPVQTNTYLLWFSPAVLLSFFLLWYVVRVRRKPVDSEAQALSTEELKRLKKLAVNQENNR